MHTRILEVEIMFKKCTALVLGLGLLLSGTVASVSAYNNGSIRYAPCCCCDDGAGTWG